MKKHLILPIVIGFFSFFSIDAFAQYCSPSVSGSWDGISKVTTTGGTVNINKTTSIGAAVRNYTATDSISSGPGQSFTVSITHNYSAGIFVDWNDDGDFTDVGETIYTPTGYENNAQRITTKTVNIPNNAATGQLRMRTMCGYYYRMAPCGYSSYTGEVEDYRLYIAPPKARDAELSDLAPRFMCAGLQDINVRVTNRGSDSLASIVLRGNIGTTTFGPTTFSGLNVKNNKDTVLKLGTFTFTSGTAYNMQFSSNSPNGATDLKTSNDTLTINGYKTSLSGTYTVGGSSPDYATPALALTALMSNGVCGPVTFNVRSGTYTGQLNFNDAIPGASSINSVRFRSDPANSVMPLIRNGSGFTLGFSGGASHISFDSLRIETTSSTRVVELGGVNDSISFNGNAFKGYNTTSSSDLYATIYDANGSNTTNFEFINNTVQYGAYGIRLYGAVNSVALSQDGFVIKNNVFTDLGYYGLYFRNCKNGVIEGNSISNKTTASLGYGIYASYNYALDLIGNKIVSYGTSWARGIYWYYCDGTSANRSLIANNMFSRPNASSSSAHYDYIYYADYTDIVHNSWYANYSYSSTSYGVIRYYAGTSDQFSNNSIANAGSAYCIRVNGTINTEKNNNYYNASNTNKRYPVSGGTGNINVDPGYVSTSDLHISTPALDKKGTALTIVTTDFDGDTRSTTTPDIGADEVLFATNDAGVASFEMSPPCPGANNVLVKVKNYGVAALTSATVNWTVKAGTGSPVTQTAFSFTGNIGVGGDTIVNLGSYTFSSGTAYTITAFTTVPNATSDQKTSNDTNSTSVSTAMGGVYTIGGTSPDYTTFAAARAALYTTGVCGAVTFNVRQGTYTERLDFQAPIAGASAVNNIRFRPDTGNTASATLRYNSDYTLRFGGNVGHITFDSLNIETYGSANVVEMNGINHHISFDGVNFLGRNINSTSSSYAIFYLWNGKYTENLTVENCTSQYGSIVFYAYSSHSGYNTTATMNDSIIIRNNEFKDFSYQGLYFQGYKNMRILNNKVHHRSTGGTAYPWGIYLSYCDLIDVVGNDVDLYNGSGQYARGLYLNYCDGSATNRNLIANNMISKGVNGSTSSAHSDNIYYCNYSDVVYNSWYGKMDYNSTSYGMIRVYYGTSVVFSNNSIHNDGGAGYGVTFTGTHTKNNNNFYNSNPLRLRYPTTGGTGNVSADPGYFSTSDLHAGGIGIYQKGTPLTIVTDDIDGDTRSATIPSIGADEFFLPAIDAAPEEVVYDLACAGSVPIKARIANKGLNGLNSFTVNWWVTTNTGTPVAQSPVSFSGTLAVGTDTVMNLGNITMNDSSNYTVMVVTSSPNGTTDQKTENDTTTKILKTGMNGVFTVGASGDFATVGAAITAIQAKGMCDDITLNVLSGTYTQRVIVENIEGTDLHNLTIKAAPSATTKPTLRYNSDYVIKINNSKNVTIDGLKIEAYGANNVIELTGDNSNFTVSNCLLDGYISTSTSTAYAIIYDWSGSANLSHNISIIDNVIQDGSYGIYVQGENTSSYQDSLVIRGNTIKNWYYRGIYNYTNENAIIDDNEIVSRATPYSTGASGIYSFYSHRGTITNNNILVSSASYCTGLYMYYCDGTSGNRALVANNMITKTKNSTSSANAEYLYYCDYTDIVNNSWMTRHNYNSSSYGAIRLYYGTGSQFSNNSIYNIGSSGYCINVVGSPTEKNNNYYNTVTSRRRYPTTGGTGNINVNPGYISTTNGDLHVNTAALDSAGTPLTIVTEDIDGDLRDATDPDIGADEFDAAKDIRLLSLDIDGGPCYTANDSVWFTYKNTGIYTLNFATDSFKVNWGVTGAVTSNGSVSITSGTLSPGAEDSAFFTVNLSDTGSYAMSAIVAATYDNKATNDSAQTTAVVTKPLAPTYSGSACYGDSLTLTGIGATGSTFNWYSDSSLSNLVASGLTVMVGVITSDTSFYMTQVGGTYGCEGFAVKTVTSPDTLPSIIFNATSAICETDTSLALSATPTGGSFSGNGVTGSGFDATSVSAGTQVLTYTYSNALGCENSDTAVVDVKVKPTVSSVFTNLTSCTVDNAKITITATGGSGTYTYSNNDGASYRSLNVFDSLAGGTYNVKVSDGICVVSGSSHTATAPNAPSKPSATGGASYCKGASLNNLGVTTTTKGTAGTFKWYKDAALIVSYGTGASVAPTDTIMTQVYYVIEDRSGCKSAADTTTVTVNALPVVSNTALAARCTNADSLVLATGTPTGGTYSGTGVSSGVFIASVATAGSHVITYNYTDGNNCSNSDTASVTVNQAPTASYTVSGSSCTNSPQYNLTGGTPTGGAYSGSGVSSNQFTAATAGAGLHTILYTVSNTNCSDSATASIRVHASPTVTLASITDRCLDAGVLTLTGGLPTGGSYSGAGVSGSNFTPLTAGSGAHTIMYTYTDGNSCTDSASTTTQVDSLPVATFSTLSNVCANGSSITLSQGSASPSGGTGTYLGTGVSGTSFSPSSVGVGTYNLGYAYVDNNGCRDTAYSNQKVDTVPIVTFSALSSVCSNSGTFSLTNGAPMGGTYSGSGITGSTFNPSSVTAGTDTLTYTYQDGNSCSDSAKQTIVVNAAPTVTLASISDRCLDAAVLSLTGGLPTGGSYSGAGVSGSNFTPLTAGSGSQTITYTYTDNNNCTDSANTTAQVDSLPVASFSTLSNICANGSQITLNQGSASPSGGTGTYIGTGVTSTMFNPSTTGAGTYNLGYAYVDNNGCRDTAYSMQTVDTVPVVAWTATLADVCLDLPAFAYTAASPMGGVFKGSGIQTSGMFKADSAGGGMHTINYVFTDGNMCMDSVTNTQWVDTLPTVNFTLPANWCLNAMAISLNSGMPSGGAYTVNGTTDTIYSSTTAGRDTLIYTYSDTNNCVNTATAYIQADTVPVVSFDTIADACVGSAMITLSQGKPLGGMYTGNNVSTGMYNPDTVRTDTLNYTFTDLNGCKDIATQTVTVNALPVVTFSSISGVCANSGMLAITNGAPTGGTYSGVGLNGSTFDPSGVAVGVDTLTYTYIDANNCTDSAKQSIEVYAAPTASMSPIGESCDNGDTIHLNMGMPAGGTYIGLGVDTNVIIPNTSLIGVNTVSYIATNTNCSDTAMANYTIVPSPLFNVVGKLEGCKNDTLTLTTSDTSGFVHNWSNGDTTNSINVSTSGMIWVQVTDTTNALGCNNYDTVDVKLEGECVGIDPTLSVNDIRYYPNPNNGNFNYEISGLNGSSAQLRIFSSNGQEVFFTEFTNMAEKETGEITLENMERGVYYIQLNSTIGSAVHRIVINR